MAVTLAGARAGAGLADTAGHHGRALRGRRAGRHHRPHPRRAHGRDARPAGDHRECRRRGRHDRRARGSPRRRPTATRCCSPAARSWRRSTRRSTGGRSTIRRPISRPWDGFRIRARADHAQGFPGEEFRRVHRLRQGQPGKLQYGSAGVGSGSHVCSLLLDQAMGTKITHVPYRGAAPAMQDVIAGRIDYRRADFDRAAAGRGPQREGDRHARAGPRLGAARSAAAARERLARSRLRRVGRVRVPQGDAGRDRAAVSRRRQRGTSNRRWCASIWPRSA